MSVARPAAVRNGNRARRIQKELQDHSQDQTTGIDLHLVNDSELSLLRGSFVGPNDTPYAGGKYLVDIVIPAEYPFRPPEMKFLTRIWHPNVSSVTGAICLDTLSTTWSPVFTITSALLMLQSLLASPEPRDPQDAEVANMMLRNMDEFRIKARQWAVTFAGAPELSSQEVLRANSLQQQQQQQQQPQQQPPQQPDEAYRGYHKPLIDQFCNMGFEVPVVVEAFEFYNIRKNIREANGLAEEYIGDITARLFRET